MAGEALSFSPPSLPAGAMAGEALSFCFSFCFPPSLKLRRAKSVSLPVSVSPPLPLSLSLSDSRVIFNFRIDFLKYNRRESGC